MIKPVYKICNACLGVGIIEKIPHVRPMTYRENQDEHEICYICHGKGYIPTGFFILEGEGDFLPQLDGLDFLDKKAILKT